MVLEVHVHLWKVLSRERMGRKIVAVMYCENGGEFVVTNVGIEDEDIGVVQTASP